MMIIKELVQVLKEDTHIKCSWCDGVSNAKDWNDETFAHCVSREMRRKFVPIYNEKVFRKNTQYYYKCPLCGKWSKGSQLSIVDTDDKKLLKLGGEPIIKIVKSHRNK